MGIIITLRKKNGFTLIELLIAVSLVMMIGLGVYKVLVSGVSIYDWFLTNAPQNDAEIFLEKISYDLKNMFPGSQSVFYGTSGKMSFFAHNTDYVLVKGDNQPKKNIKDDLPLYGLEYRYDGKKNNVVRKVYRFGDGALEKENVVLENVKNMNFEFCSFDSVEKKMSTFMPLANNYPAAVKINIEIGGTGRKVYDYNKIIEIPVNLT